MAVDLMDRLREKARRAPQRVVLPESEDETILRAARAAADEGVARPVLVGAPAALGAAAQRAGVGLDGLQTADIIDDAMRDELLEQCRALFPDISPQRAERRMRSPLHVASFLVAAGRADAMVAGRLHTTQEVIAAARLFIGMREGATTLSSMFLMRVPGFAGPEGEYIVFADCGVAVTPDAAELAEIALATAGTVRDLLGWEPRVALLSFSTKASGYDESVARVREALRLVREREPGLAVDGELQLDAAIIPTVAARKAPGEDLVAGRANVLIFPDLNAGNIAYKSVQRFAGADAYGPFLQGMARTVSDLSRGASVADVLGAITMVSVAAQGGGPAGPGGAAAAAAGGPGRVANAAPAGAAARAAAGAAVPGGAPPGGPAT